MKIGILGAGQMACALTELFVGLGHSVMLSNSRGPDSLNAKALRLGCEAGSSEDAAIFGDIVVLAIPLHALKGMQALPLTGKTLIDLTNYYPTRDGAIAEIDAGRSTTSELVACHFPQSHVVKAFNAIMVGDLRTHGIPPGTRGRRALPIAGDDPASMRCVSDLIDACGFDPVDTGPLAQGWRFERARPVYCIPLDRTALAQRLAETRRDSMVAEGSWHRK